MRMTLTLLFISLLPLLATSQTSLQEQEIEVTMEQGDSTLIYLAYNKTKVTHEVTLSIKADNLSGYNGPVTKLIPPDTYVPMITLGYDPYEPYSVRSQYSYTPKPTPEEAKLQEFELKRELLESFDAENIPVIVFYGEGCSRSEYTRKFLERKKIPFKYLETTKNEYNNKAMFTLIRMKDPYTNRIQFPVIMTMDRLDYDIGNLSWYLKELASDFKK